MAMKFNIGKKIGAGFGALIFLTLINFIATYITLHQSKTISNEISEIYTPSVEALEDLNLSVVKSKMLIYSWVFTSGDNEEKEELKKLIKTDYPVIVKRIRKLEKAWNEEDAKKVDDIFKQIDKLFKELKNTMNNLGTFESYDDFAIKEQEEYNVKPGGDIDKLTNEILDELDDVIKDHQEKSVVKNAESKRLSSLLQTVVSFSGLMLLFGGIFIAYTTIKTIVRPINEFKNIILKMGKGVLPKDKLRDRDDEIGEMAVAINLLVSGLKRTTDFSKEISNRNYDWPYEPLSKDDNLGHSLLNMKDELRDYQLNLEKKIEERTEEVVRKNNELEKIGAELVAQNEKIEHLYQDVTDSIKYAKRIQNSILPVDSYVKSLMPNSFIYYQPKDIVSGDFYWIKEKNGKCVFAAVDCTGHGVPGAFMSLIGSNILSILISEMGILDPSTILTELHQRVIVALQKDFTDVKAHDGMDVSLIVIDKDTNKIQFSGAVRPLYHIRNGQLYEIKGDRYGIGSENPTFTTIDIDVEKGDTFYLFTDGYADQFGGVDGKKYMSKKFKEHLLEIQSMSMSEQREVLRQTIRDWRGPLEQIDDQLVIGVRF
jgi:serine phosphatase RsbU (regulator of sigma subunit)/CHASE3 domain sensor protein